MRDSASIASTFINFVFGVAEAILGFRLILKFFGANEGTPFVQWVYRLSEPLLRPFQNIFPPLELSERFVVDLTALFAIIVYSVVARLLTELIVRLGRS